MYMFYVSGALGIDVLTLYSTNANIRKETFSITLWEKDKMQCFLPYTKDVITEILIHEYISLNSELVRYNDPLTCRKK